ncbi:MAG TPA: hypothetical protein VMT62_02845 [Syntrophorhabdaceae bacterium]|nr:hypothetical protein [Syntrophorhabdaceae bacterium]
MKKTVTKQSPSAQTAVEARVLAYPATADSVDLPDLSFTRSKNEDAFIALGPAKRPSPERQTSAVADRVAALDGERLWALLAPILSQCPGSAITVRITGRPATLVKITRNRMDVTVEVHWNLLVPYFDQIKSLPIVHPEVLGIFADAVIHYMVLAIKHQTTRKNEPWDHVIDDYRIRPQLLLASLDIFNKPNVYHIHPIKTWLRTISAVSDEYRLEIDAAAIASVPSISRAFLDELTGFIHKIVKNYAFRYGDYLWTQQYKITFGARLGPGMVKTEGKNIVINIHPLIGETEWKPTVYLSLGYAIMYSILIASGRNNREKCMYLALMKTWSRYLSFDEPREQPSVREVCGFPHSKTEEECRSLSECLIGEESRNYVDEFLMLVNYSSKETFMERLETLNDRYEGKAGLHFEQLSNTIRNLNITLMRNNISHGKLIEVLRSDSFDHMALADLLRTGRLDNRSVVDVSEWLLLRTLLYDLINAPKVFRNDYKMLLKVLTRVNKSLLVYVWTLGLENDARYEIVSAYIAKVMHEIFVFDRVKIYEIVSDPVECLEAEAVTGYLLNWASFTPEARRSIVEGVLSGLSRNVVTQLKVQTTGDVDQMVRVMGTRASGLIGFYLHQAYLWGSVEDELTERIRSHFPKLLKQAQRAVVPAETIRGGAMLLLLLAQIVSDERDGFARNIVVTEQERQIVQDLIRQCLDWDQRHFIMMIAGMAAGYMGNIDGWALQQFDRLLARYDGGDRVMLRSVVQFDVEILIERTLTTAKIKEENALLNKIQLLRYGVDPVVSDEANRYLGTMAYQCGIASPEDSLKKKDIRELLLTLSKRIKVRSA